MLNLYKMITWTVPCYWCLSVSVSVFACLCVCEFGENREIQEHLALISSPDANFLNTFL